MPMSGTGIAYRPRQGCAMSGTDIAYGGRRHQAQPPAYHPMHSAVLTSFGPSDVQYNDGVPSCAMCGTDMA
eukprot:3932763-Rhodomonas_salina.2